METLKQDLEVWRKVLAQLRAGNAGAAPEAVEACGGLQRAIEHYEVLVAEATSEVEVFCEGHL